MTPLELYLSGAVFFLLLAVLYTILWEQGGSKNKEPTYRIREYYGKDGRFGRMRLLYQVEVKTRFSWKPLGLYVTSMESAEWNLQHHIRQKAESEKEKEIIYYTSKGETFKVNK